MLFSFSPILERIGYYTKEQEENQFYETDIRIYFLYEKYIYLFYVHQVKRSDIEKR